MSSRFNSDYTESGAAAAPRHIGPRTGFFGDASEAQSLLGGYDRDPEDDIFGPVSGVKVSVVDVFPGGVDVTGADGKYHFSYRLPPGEWGQVYPCNMFHWLSSQPWPDHYVLSSRVRSTT